MGEQVAAGFMWGCSSVGRAPALQAGGQEFESLHLHSVSKDNKKDIRETDTATYLENRILKIKIILKRNIKTSEKNKPNASDNTLVIVDEARTRRPKSSG